MPEMRIAAKRKVVGMRSVSPATMNAARIPTPPPRGVGTVWELRSLGASSRCSLNGIPAISDAPAAPRPAQLKNSRTIRYSVTLSTSGINKIAKSFIRNRRYASFHLLRPSRPFLWFFRYQSTSLFNPSARPVFVLKRQSSSNRRVS